MTVEDLMVAVVVLTSQYMIDITVFDDEKQFVVVTNAYSSDCRFRRSAFGDDPTTGDASALWMALSTLSKKKGTRNDSPKRVESGG